jgi:ubiquinone/menaquinone biosynthesis C-methylase UbiE/DNA-binding transcriptional ArsR family regulator
MPSIVKILRAAAEPSRLRILLLLKEEELSVAELQEILVMGQSSISTHLSQLKQAGLVEDRRTGKNNLYRLTLAEGTALYQGTTSVVPKAAQNKNGALAPAAGDSFLNELLARAAKETPEAEADQAAMRRVVKKRQDKMRAFFDSMAGRLGRDYVPGKSWKSLAEAFVQLLPPMVIADLGAGDGSSAVLLSQNAIRVIGVDSSEKMLDVARDQARRAGAMNVEFRLGEMEEVPIDDASVDLVFFSQSLHHTAHPERALREGSRILRPSGRIVVLDLAKHRFEEARELYADEWLGFSEADIEAMLVGAGFTDVQASVVDRDPDAPQFQTLLAVGSKVPRP